MGMKRHELSDEQWNQIKEKLPPERKAKGGCPAKDNRSMLNAMLYWLNTGVLLSMRGKNARHQVKEG